MRASLHTREQRREHDHEEVAPGRTVQALHENEVREPPELEREQNQGGLSDQIEAGVRDGGGCGCRHACLLLSDARDCTWPPLRTALAFWVMASRNPTASSTAEMLSR